jgi:hypothetical protein
MGKRSRQEERHLLFTVLESSGGTETVAKLSSSTAAIGGRPFMNDESSHSQIILDDLQISESCDTETLTSG